jgi:hypothetical protein
MSNKEWGTLDTTNYRGGVNMKLRHLFVLIVCGVLFLSACSSNQEEKSSAGNTSQPTSEFDAKQETSSDRDTSNQVVDKEGTELPTSTNKVIYTAELYLQVRDIKKTNKSMEEKAVKHGGYVVESQMYLEDEGNYNATLTLRIPEKNFNQYLSEVEELAVKVQQKNVRGSDVSEEYVDLESRLASKRTVEKRLMEFMQKAEATEDLLKISTDLARVQEEIETITGRLKFLDNKIAFSTVTLTLNENIVKVPKLENSDLNTWEKTKKQFITSVNFILAASSGAVVILFGNLPIILLIGVIVGITFYIIKRKKKQV